MPKTITALVERKLSFAKIIAVSHDRRALLDRAQEEWLSISRGELDHRGHTKIDDLTEANLEEVELLHASEDVQQPAIGRTKHE